MTVSTSISTPPGIYPISVIGTAGGSSPQTNTVTLIVSGFTLYTTSQSESVNAGNSTNFTVSSDDKLKFQRKRGIRHQWIARRRVSDVCPAHVERFRQFNADHFNDDECAVHNLSADTIYGTNGSLIVTNSVSLTVIGFQANPGTLVWTNGAGK